jgi:hypothetical protein
VSPPVRDRARLLRGVLLMLMFMAGCVAGLALVTATAAHASIRPQATTSPADLSGTLDEVLGRTAALPLRLRPSPHLARPIPNLVRTVEDVPGTPHRSAMRATEKTVTAAVGETPRVLDRTGQAAAHPVGLAHAQPAARSLPTQSRARGHHPWRHPAVRHGIPAHRRHRAPTASNDHRTPWPYAPTTPASVTAGPAVSSSNAAGPASPMPRANLAQRIALGLPLAPASVAAKLRSIADAPGHTPD